MSQQDRWTQYEKRNNSAGNAFHSYLLIGIGCAGILSLAVPNLKARVHSADLMLTLDQAPALVFVVLVALVYVFAARILIVIALGKAGRLQVPSNRGAVYFQRMILALAVVGLFCFAYGYFVEPYWPEVTRVALRTRKFEGADEVIRIVHISDLHSDPRPRLEERLPGMIADLKPDLILFSGDAVNSREGIPVFRECISQIARIAPTYVVKGNWDLGVPGEENLFAGTGVYELNGEAATIRIRSANIWLAGIPVSRAREVQNIVKKTPRDAFSIFLYHYPDEIYEVADKVDLYCAGHTHGGQVALPQYGALITLSRFGKRFEAGLFQVGQTYLYVNRGIGMEGGLAPRVRFWSRPEITLYEIRGAFDKQPRGGQ